MALGLSFSLPRPFFLLPILQIAMSSFGGERHSPEHALGLSGIIELPHAGPPLDSEEEDVFFRVTQRPCRVGGPSIITLPSPPTSSSLDLVGSLVTISTMIRTIAFHLWGMYKILETTRILA